MGPVVVALQGNPADDAEVDYEAAALAQRAGSGLVAVRVVPLSDPRVPRVEGPLAYLGPHLLLSRGGDPRLESAAQAARAAGVDTQTVLVAAADAAAAIAEVANRHDASVILLEPPGGGRLARVRGGRLARRVRRHAHSPVFIVGRAPVSIAERSR